MNPTNEPGSFGCDSFAEDLSLFAFGELDGERRDALARHLVGCAACRAERDALVRSLELLKQEGERATGDAAPHLSAARQANLLAQAQAAAPAAGRVIAWRRLAVAAVVVAAAGGMWYASTLTPREREDRVCFRAAAPVADSSELDATAGRRVENFKGDLDALIESNAPTKDRAETLGREAAGGKSLSSAHAGLPAEKAPPTDESTILSLQPKAGAAKPDALSAKPADAKDGDGESRGLSEALTKEVDVMPLPAPTAGVPAPMKQQLGAPAQQPPAPPSPLPHKEMGPGRASSSGPTDFAARQKIGVFLYAGVDDADLVETVTQLSDEAAPDAVDGRAVTLTSEQLDQLKRLGYAAGDGGESHSDDADAGRRFLGSGAGPNVDPVQLGRLLAASLSPAQSMRVQALIVARLGVDPAQPPRPTLEADRDAVIRSFLDQLARRQSEPPRDMFFRYFGDHPFVPTRVDARSTFGMDVDTASYSLVRSYLAHGTLPPKAAVRTEEFVNAFRHDLAPPDDGVTKVGRVRDDDRPASGFAATGVAAPRDVFAIHTELAPSPFGEDGQYLLQIGLKAREIPKSARKPVALTFVIDVSGSMEIDGRLELVKKGLHLLVDQLDERDTVGIVSFETTGHVVLEPVDASRRARIFAALDTLRPEGSTNADDGLRMGYAMALAQLRPNAENRVVLCSDGVANTGVTDPKVLAERIAECKSKYIYLNCVGVGMGNHNDALMEQLADEGDGFCAYLDRIEEAKKLFVDRLTGTLLTVARDAKIQVEFDPACVRRFRQLGYEKRALAHRDFRNDEVDAGEVGAGHEVVALYELELTRDALAREAKARDAEAPLATVRVRYQDPDVGEVREQSQRVDLAELRPTVQQTTPRFRLSACVAEFAEILRQSVHARDGSFGAVERLAEPLVDELKGDPDVPEFVALVKQAARLPDLIPARSGLARAVDEVKKFRCWREELKEGADEEMLRQLEEQNRRLEQALRDALDRALRRS